MGTNYYVRKKPGSKKPLHPKLAHLSVPSEGLHVGKSSCGWTFTFRSHGTFPASFSDWKQILAQPNAMLVDEAGAPMDAADFEKLVTLRCRDRNAADGVSRFAQEHFKDADGHAFAPYDFN